MTPPLRLFLRTTVPRLRLTAVRPTPLSDEGSIHLDPQLCWAMELKEFERVEVTNLSRCLSFAAHVRFGRAGDAIVTQSTGPLMQTGDTLRISAVSWLAANKDHSALLVLVNDFNAPIEIRHVVARTADLDPVSFPVPPALEYVNIVPRAEPIETMD